VSEGRTNLDALLPDEATSEEASLDPKVTETLLEQPFFLGDTLRVEVKTELDRREGSWTAFSAGVFRQIDEAARAQTRLSLEDRAIEALKQNVEAEIADLEPRFERAFREGIERQIWRAAKAPPSLLDRVRSWLDAQPWRVIGGASPPARRGRGPEPVRIAWSRVGLATAMAMILGLLVFRGLDRGQNDALAVMDAVSVDEVSFEGTVTLMPADNGMTVVWLGSDGSS
jgi:hypothetical protein